MSDTTKTEFPLALKDKPRLESIPPLLASARDYLQTVLPLLLRVVFEKADDTFFELAEKAQIAAEQKIYFNAKKELRVKRRTIETSYLLAMQEVFHLQPEPPSTNQQSETERILNNISIDDPMFRVFIVFDAMIDKANNQLQDSVNKVTQQLNALLPDYVLDKYNSPLSIYTLTENFLLACECLNIETEEKIIVLNMFEKYVLGDFDRVLSRVHRLLSDGEIASLASAKQKPKSNKEILKKSADGKITSKTKLADEVGVDPQEDNKKEYLMAQLIELQKESLARAGSFDLKQMTGLVMSIANDLHIESDSIIGKKVQQAVDLIRMLFNFILSENASDDLTKWLIQLYLPLLRAVLIDVTVLSSESHAARRLLNEIAKAAVDVKLDSSIEDDLFRRHISRVIERVVNEFDRDLSIFPELFVDFKSVIDDERKRQKIIKQRMQEVNGSAEQLEKAKAIVDKKLMRLYKNKEIPTAITDFLNQHWTMVLCLLYLKEGDKSIEWNQAIDVAEFIVESVLPENKGIIIHQLAGFLEVINKAMASIGVTSAETLQFFAALEALHLQHYQMVRERAEKRLASKPTAIPVASAQDASEESIFESVVPDDLMDAILIEADITSEEDGREERREQAKRSVDSLTADMWLEFYPQPDKKMRVKIATILKPSQKFIFVDRDGKKVIEKTIDEMVEAIEQGIFKLLDADSLFGKALAMKRK